MSGNSKTLLKKLLLIANSKVPRWETLNSLLNNRVVRSSGIWLIVTPITAKFFSKINEVKLSFFDNSIVLSLPFSWVLFFFSALSFFLAVMLFGIYCPSAIKNYKDLSDFRSKDGSRSKLLDMFLYGVPEHYYNEEGQKGFDDFKSRWGMYVGLSKSEKPYGFNDLMEKGIDEVFMGLRMTLQHSCPAARFFITVFFIIGCLFFSFVLIENVIFVINSF